MSATIENLLAVAERAKTERLEKAKELLQAYKDCDSVNQLERLKAVRKTLDSDGTCQNKT